FYIPMHSMVALQTRVGPNFGERYTDPNRFWVQIMGRLKPGVTIAQAQSALAGGFHAMMDSAAKTPKEKADLPALVVAEGAAGWGIDLLTTLIGSGRPNFTLHAQLNWNVLAVTLGMSVITGVLFGLAPAMQATRVDLACALKQSGLAEQRRKFGTGQVLVSLQI